MHYKHTDIKTLNQNVTAYVIHTSIPGFYEK